MSNSQSFYEAKLALEWQYEFGVDEAISDAPINRYEIEIAPPKLKINPKSNIAHVSSMSGLVETAIAAGPGEPHNVKMDGAATTAKLLIAG